MSDGHPDEEGQFPVTHDDETGLGDSAADALEEGNGG
jgi:hypothetical protein